MLAMDFGLHKPIAIVDPPTEQHCELGIHTPLALMQNFRAWIRASDLVPPYLLRALTPAETVGRLSAVRVRTHARHARPRGQVERVLIGPP